MQDSNLTNHKPSLPEKRTTPCFVFYWYDLREHQDVLLPGIFAPLPSGNFGSQEQMFPGTFVPSGVRLLAHRWYRSRRCLDTSTLVQPV